ncbi:hypothetical protein HY572_05080 [Candidatus Micrarchaeota archaeon]|nr:hypothetical protein [Candidatus Micrarchaeota archaeon]
MHVREARRWLEDLAQPDSWHLSRMEHLVKDSGLDLNRFESVSVAGTNGKGSTSAFIAFICRAAGLKTGWYTSPHLLDVRERIWVDGRFISEKEFAAVASWAQPLVEKHHASYFEALTLMAFKHFLDQGVKIAVLEAGLGGRLDATAVAKAQTSVVTNIALEHKLRLGNSLTKIAYEKAGIIQPNAVVFTAAKGEAFDVLGKAAAEKKATLSKVPPLPVVQSTPLGVRLGAKTVHLGLDGLFQAENAALAVAVAGALKRKGFSISVEAVASGLTYAVIPGRMQRIGRFVVDGAHNPAAMDALVSSLLSLYPGKRWHVVFGVLDDKDYPEMVQTLCRLPLDSVMVVTPNSPRGLDADTLLPFFSERKVDAGLGSVDALPGLSGDVLVCGSLVLAGEALEKLGKRVVA